MGARQGSVLLDGGPGVVLAGHVAEGPGPARVAVLRTGGLALFGGASGSPAGWWRSPALEPADPQHDAVGCATAAGIHHGVNRPGLLVACTPGGPLATAGIAGALLAHAAGVAEGEALVSAAGLVCDAPDRVWLADAGGSVSLEVGSEGIRRVPGSHPPAAAGGLDAVLEALRRDGGAGAASALAVRLDAGAEPIVLVCLGPPGGGVFVRQWPGIPGPPPLTGASDRPPRLGALAEALAEIEESAPGQRPAIRSTLAAVEAEVLAEGEEAERMARIMDTAGDDHGREVRRALAQSYAADLAVGAMEHLLAGSRRDSGPTL
jgi:hypothetical protein